MCLVWGRIRKTKILWTVHNLASHSRRHPRLESYFWQLFTRLLDGFISLSSAGVTQAQHRFQRFKTLPGFVVPHGHYRTSYPNNIERAEARQALAIPPASPLFLFLGAISPYKNVLNLITVFRQSAEQSWRLCVAGQLSPQISLNKLNEAVGEDPRVLIHIGRVPTEKVQIYFRAADLVVLPFQEIFNSGSALLALSLGRPVLAPAKGALPELQSTVGREWISIYQEELKTVHLVEAMAWALQTNRGAEAPLSSLEWPPLAQMTLDAYQAVLQLATKERELHGLLT
jgi:glycosyltransferase involved in cell wall biosynthesis